ncbi:Uncharacterised protein at_DN1932 [Pycnogonum litorale]
MRTTPKTMELSVSLYDLIIVLVTIGILLLSSVLYFGAKLCYFTAKNFTHIPSSRSKNFPATSNFLTPPSNLFDSCLPQFRFGGNKKPERVTYYYSIGRICRRIRLGS